MRYAILARDSFSAGNDDGALYTLVIEVEAGSRSDAHDKAKKLAEESELEVEALHDGCACYEVVQTKEEILDAVRRLRAEHNSLHELAKVTVVETANKTTEFNIELGEWTLKVRVVPEEGGSFTFRPESRAEAECVVELFEDAVEDFGYVDDAHSDCGKYVIKFQLDDVDGFRTKYEVKKK